MSPLVKTVPGDKPSQRQPTTPWHVGALPGTQSRILPQSNHRVNGFCSLFFTSTPDPTQPDPTQPDPRHTCRLRGGQNGRCGGKGGPDGDGTPHSEAAEARVHLATHQTVRASQNRVCRRAVPGGRHPSDQQKEMHRPVRRPPELWLGRQRVVRIPGVPHLSPAPSRATA